MTDDLAALRAAIDADVNPNIIRCGDQPYHRYQHRRFWPFASCTRCGHRRWFS